MSRPSITARVAAAHAQAALARDPEVSVCDFVSLVAAELAAEDPTGPLEHDRSADWGEDDDPPFDVEALSW